MPHPPADLSPYAPINAPIDLPDDFGLDDDGDDLRVIVWVSVALFLAFVIAAVLLLGAFA